MVLAIRCRSLKNFLVEIVHCCFLNFPQNFLILNEQVFILIVMIRTETIFSRIWKPCYFEIVPKATLARKIFRSKTFVKPCYRMSLFLIGFYCKTTCRHNFQLKSQNSLVLLWFTFKKEGWNLACFCSAISKFRK